MSRPVFPLDQIGVHEIQLREAIGQFDLPGSARPLAGPVTIMLFTNRSGSSLLADHLRATGRFRGMGEPLNPGLVLSTMESEGHASFHAYLKSRVDRNQSPDSMFGMKASLQQVLMLLRARIIPGYFNDVRWVFMQRRDLVAQAVSFEIASQTKRWESFAKDTGVKPQYDFERSRKKVQALSLQNASINALFSVLGVQPVRVFYEDFAVSPIPSTVQLASLLGMADARVDEASLRRRKQRDEINAAFQASFREEYLAWLLAQRAS